MWVEIQIISSGPTIPPVQDQRQDYIGGFSLQSSGSHPLWINSRRACCKQRKVFKNPLLPHGCSEKEIPRKMDIKQLVSCPQQCTRTSVIDKEKLCCKWNVMVLDHLPYSLELSLPDIFLFLWLKNVLKRQWLMRADEVTAKVMRALT
jgi:hypothetical protein